MRAEISVALVAIAASFAVCPAAAQERGPTEAESLFRQGREAFNKGDTDAACRLLFDAASFSGAYDPSWPYSWECFHGPRP